MSKSPKIQHVQDKGTTIKSMIILALLFFIFGLVSWVNTILIPYFELTLQLTRFQSYLVTFVTGLKKIIICKYNQIIGSDLCFLRIDVFI